MGDATFKANSESNEVQALKYQIATLEKKLDYYEKSILEYTNSLLKEIFERKKSEEELRNLYLRYKVTLDSAPGIIMEVDPDKVYIWANQAGYDFFGPDVIGKEASYYFEDILEVYNLVQPLFEGKDEIISLDSWQRRQDGQIRLLSWRCRALKDEQGVIKSVISSAIDITDQTRNELKLRENASFLQTLLNSIPIPIYYKDAKGIYLGCNEKFCNFIRREKGEIVGKDVWSISPKELADIYYKQDNELINHPGIQIYESKVQSSDGSKRTVIFNKATFLSNDGSIGGLIGAILDITERKLAEDALRESEEKMRIIFESLSEGLVIIDLNGRVMEANDAAIHLYGFDNKAELIGLNYNKLFEESDLTRATQQLDRLFKHGEVKTGEYTGVKKDGKKFIAEMSANVIKNPSGQPEATAIIFRDISKRKEVEARILLDDARLESLVRISQFKAHNIQEFLDFALDEAITLTSSKIAYIYFYNSSKKEFTLNTWSKGVMRECTIPNPQTVYQLEKTGIWGEAVRQRKPIIVNDFQAPNLLKKGYPEGHAKLNKFLTIPVFSDEDIVAVVGVANKETDYDNYDVRQLTVLMDSVWKFVLIRKSEEALSQSEEKLRIMFESLSEGFILVDLKGSILEVNNAAVSLCGCLNKEELIGQNITDFIDKEDISRIIEYIKYTLNSGITRTEEFTGIKKNGIKYPAEASASVIRNMSGSQIGIISIFRDISARKQAEEQTLQIESLKKLNQAKNELLANVSHELRTPLTSIKGYIETILMPDIEWSNKQQLEYLDLANQETDHLMSIIQNLLDMSRLDAGRIHFEKQICSITDILKIAQTSLNTITKKHILKYSIPEDLPKFSADQNRLAQVVINLVENAAKFSPEGSEITIETAVNDKEIIIKVKDRGIGLSKEDLSRLFDRFFQAERVVSGKTRGTGLGLSISKGIVTAHDGKIWAISELGKGSTFCFSLPIVTLD